MYTRCPITYKSQRFLFRGIISFERLFIKNQAFWVCARGQSRNTQTLPPTIPMPQLHIPEAAHMKLRNVFSFPCIHCPHLLHASFGVDTHHLLLTSFPGPLYFPRDISNIKKYWSFPRALACHEDFVPLETSESTSPSLTKGLDLPPGSVMWGFLPFDWSSCACVCI